MSIGDGAQGLAAARYQTGYADREPYLVRARRISRLSIASLYREWGATGASDEVIPWQSLLAYCINNLAAKLVLSMFPPGISNVHLKPSRASMKDAEQLPPDQRAKLMDAVDKALAKEELLYAEGCEEDGDRAVFFDAARHMLVGGNYGLSINPDGATVGYPLEQYVVWRDRAGNLLEFCIEDPMAYDSLPPDVQDMVRANGYGPTEGDKESEHHGQMHHDGSNWEIRNPLWAPINVYTHGRLREGLWHVCTEAMGEEVPGSSMPYKPELLPYVFLRMVALKKEAYGRSYCEDYEADFQTYDAIWQALTEGGALLARMITLIRSGGTLSKDAYAKAANGATLTGDKDEVAVVRSDKGGDLTIILNEADRIESRLERMFILNSAVERKGERVTATEISFKAQELDTTLGGVYSNQVNSWQRPVALLKIAAYMRNDRMAKLPKGATKVTIITGDAALGRMKQAQALEEYMGVMGQILTPPILARWVNPEVLLSRAGTNRSIDTDGLIKSKDQVDQEDAQAQAHALAQQAAPNAVNQLGQMAQNVQTGAAQGAAPEEQSEPPQGATPNG